MISKRKKNLEEFMIKYQDLEKAIAEYKEEQFQIQVSTTKVETLQSHIKEITKKNEQI